jgi:hypothetical protein
MKKKLFDRFLRDRVHGHESKLDIDALWLAIEPELQKKKRRRLLFLWWLFPLSGILFLYFNPCQQNTAQSTGGLVNGGAAKTSALASTDLYAITKTIANSNLDVNKTVAKQARLDQSQVSAQNVKELSLSQLAMATAQLPKNVTLIQEKISSSSLQTNISLLKNASVVDKIPPLNNQLPMLLSCYSPNLITVTQKSNWQPFIAGRFTTGLISQQHIESSGENTNLIALRNATETPMEFYKGNISVGINYKNRWTAQSGLSYLQLTDRFDNSQILRLNDSLQNGIISYTVTDLGDTLKAYGNIPFTKVLQKDQRFYNHYSWFELPITLGHQWQYNRMIWGVEATASLPFGLRKEGILQLTEQTQAQLNDIDIRLGRVQTSFGGYLGFVAPNRCVYTLGVQSQKTTLIWKNPQIIQDQRLTGISLQIKMPF